MKPYTAFAAFLLAAAGLAAHATPPAAAPASGAALKGEVLEVRNVENYTYLRLKTKDGETWAAVQSASVKKGAQVTLDNPMVMENFESKSLRKKFDRIVFASLADPNGKPAASIAAAHGAAAAPTAPVAKLAKASGPDAKTVAEIVTGKAALKDRNVTLHAQVVKVSNGILGKNWIHLQDGSGSAAKGTQDIVATTTDTTTVGQVVNVTATVHTDVNIGSGYAYAVLLENAKIRK